MAIIRLIRGILLCSIVSGRQTGTKRTGPDATTGKQVAISGKTVAREAERIRRRELEESWNHIKRRKLPSLFAIASTDWLKTRTGIAPSTTRSYKIAISRLTKDFGKQLLCDICSEDIAVYQTRRKGEGVSNRTVNLELGVLRSILRRHRMWEGLAADVDFLKENPSPGRALTYDENCASWCGLEESLSKPVSGCNDRP
jgi:hypothetical protein